MKKYPALKDGLAALSYNQIKELRQAQKPPRDEPVDYVSLIDGRKNTYLYTSDPRRGTVEDPCEIMTIEEATLRLKAHRDALFAEWRRPQPQFIISRQSMIELN